MQHQGYLDSYQLTASERASGIWVRVTQPDGETRAAVLAVGRFTIYLDRYDDGPMIGDHSEHDPSEVREIVGLARFVNADRDALGGCHAVARVTARLAR